jgi:hypothetical protein
MVDDPLIVPADEALRLGKALAPGLQVRELRFDMVDDGVVKFQESHLKLRDDQVLVVARIGHQSGKLTIARNVQFSGAVPRLGRRVLNRLQIEFCLLGLLIVEVWRSIGAGAVDAVQLEQRRTEIRNRFGVLLPFQARGRVEGQVVIKELAEERETCAQVGIIGIVHAHQGVGDQFFRVI